MAPLSKKSDNSLIVTKSKMHLEKYTNIYETMYHTVVIVIWKEAMKSFKILYT